MIYKYERICRNENLTEEHIKKIDNGLHALTQAKYREEQVYITVKMYPCSGGTDTRSPEL